MFNRDNLFCIYFVFVMTCLLSAVPARGVDWEGISYTEHSTLQAVNADGSENFTGTFPIKMKGVILNDHENMLDSTPSDVGMGGRWQIFFQTVEADDFGGTACWMGQNIPWMGNYYSDQEWLDEMDRVNHDPDTGHEFRPGDLVEVRARAGLYYKGKFNVNEAHEVQPEYDFDIHLLQSGYGLPAPTQITLADLQADPGAAGYHADYPMFDPSGQTGAEKYQGTLVRINDVKFTDDSGWEPDAELVLTDATGEEFKCKLGLGDGFGAYDAPTGEEDGYFDVIGILDQESPGDPPSNRDGYRIWVMDYCGGEELLAGLRTGDVNGDWLVNADDLAIILQNFGGSYDERNKGDLVDDGVVNTDDLASLLQNFGGAGTTGSTNHVPGPATTLLFLVGSAAALGRSRQKRGR